MYLLAVLTAAIHTDFIHFQWISDMVVNTDAECCIHCTNATENNMVCAQTKTSYKRDHQIVFPTKLPLWVIFLLLGRLFKIYFIICFQI